MSALADPFSPEEKALARTALGLPNCGRRSYRNRFFIAAGAETPWASLVERHLARRYPARKGETLDLFVLTRAGAERALEPGETLDPEDFPTIGQD